MVASFETLLPGSPPPTLPLAMHCGDHHPVIPADHSSWTTVHRKHRANYNPPLSLPGPRDHRKPAFKRDHHPPNSGARDRFMIPTSTDASFLTLRLQLRPMSSLQTLCRHHPLHSSVPRLLYRPLLATCSPPVSPMYTCLLHHPLNFPHQPFVPRPPLPSTCPLPCPSPLPTPHALSSLIYLSLSISRTFMIDEPPVYLPPFSCELAPPHLSRPSRGFSPLPISG
ncbi:hypothetical protein AMTR_s00065p00055590, partial [Amborella trichopoda]